ncbi:HAAS signaling domain-containing protein [Thermoactinospora rubra]|uniref:HAAS signaling domain-containing protein n=1 Tax=Thermoactinospora rubra TaxID=1088767 RepID=UPI000A0FF3D2|nr:hypothetical protein [Thermoactinospora rubra]
MTVLNKRYMDELTMALRVRNVDGRRVGEVLAEVESHVAETGEDPVTAFGPAREYAARVAAELDAAGGKKPTAHAVLGGIATGVLTYFGVGLLLGAIGSDGAIAVTRFEALGVGITLVLSLAAAFVLMRATIVLKRARLWVAGGVALLLAALLGGPILKWRAGDSATWVELPRAGAAVAGGVLLAAAVASLYRAIREGWIVRPRTGGDPAP